MPREPKVVESWLLNSEYVSWIEKATPETTLLNGDFVLKSLMPSVWENPPLKVIQKFKIMLRKHH